MTGIDRVKRKLEESIEASLASTPLDLIVMGPSLEDQSPAATLRRKIIEAAQEYGVTIKPEHQALIESASRRLGAGHSLTAYEWYLVGVSHLVVLLPASPGSFCELGLLTANGDFSPKLLILADATYPRRGSYVADGPLTAASNYRAEVHFVNYNDFEFSWSLVKTVTRS